MGKSFKLMLEDDSEKKNDNLVIALRNVIKGKTDINELYDADDSIDYIRVKSPIGKTLLNIKFKDGDLAEGIGLKEDDVWFIRALNSYDGYQFIDDYSAKEDFLEGYVFRHYINDENKEKLKFISSILLPNEKFDLDNLEFSSLLAAHLLDDFTKEFQEIIWDYTTEKNNQMTESAKNHIQKEFFDALDEIGIKIVDDYDLNEVQVDLGDLYMNALRFGLYNEKATDIIKGIIRGSNKNQDLGGWYDSAWDIASSGDIDIESFNRTVSYELDKIVEKLESNENLEQYLDLRKKIISKYGFDKYHVLPKNKKYHFKIVGFDVDTLKINVLLSTPIGMKEIKVSEENFNHLLYQPTLFDLTEI